MKIVKLLLKTVPVFAICTLLVLLLSSQSNPSQQITVPQMCTSLYPTLFSPSSIDVIDRDTILVQEIYSLSEYRIPDRNSRYIFSSDNPIIDFLTLDTSLLILTREENSISLNHVKTSVSHQIPPTEKNQKTSKSPQVSTVIATFPANSAALFGKNSLCVTTIHNISSPEQIATEIQIYRFYPSGEVAKITDLSTPLTLLPTNCEDPLYLRPPFPIAPSLYRWDIDGKSNTINLNNPEALAISKIPQPEKIPEIDPINYSQLNNTKIAPGPHNDPVADSSPLHLRTRDASSPHIARLETEDSSSAVLEGRTLIVHLPEKTAIYTVPTTLDDFTEIIIVDQSTFALISATGELWILQCNEKFTFSGNNFFFKLYGLPSEDIIPVSNFTHFLTGRSSDN